MSTTPSEPPLNFATCELHFKTRNLGIRPCVFHEEKGVRYAVFFNEEKTRIDLILANRGNGTEVLYVSKELQDRATSIDV